MDDFCWSEQDGDNNLNWFRDVFSYTLAQHTAQSDEFQTLCFAKGDALYVCHWNKSPNRLRRENIQTFLEEVVLYLNKLQETESLTKTLKKTHRHPTPGKYINNGKYWYFWFDDYTALRIYLRDCLNLNRSVEHIQPNVLQRNYRS